MEHFYIKNFFISFTEKPQIISLPYVTITENSLCTENNIQRKVNLNS